MCSARAHLSHRVHATSRPCSLAGRLEARVRHLSEAIGPRHYRRPEALAAAARYIAEQLAAMGANASEQEFFVNGQRFVNLEVIVPAAVGPGSAPACLVIGAHYDTVPSTPGADDNASGVAALLELVQQLGHERLKRSLRLVFFVNEDRGAACARSSAPSSRAPTFRARACRHRNGPWWWG